MRDAIDMKRTMFTVVIAMIPALLFGIWNTGHQHFLAFHLLSLLFQVRSFLLAAEVFP
jgi:Na+-transporting NADH:ubiquinone oxidoreductase subunit B